MNDTSEPSARECADVPTASEESGGRAGVTRLIELPVESIERPETQPRKTFDPDKLAELADSIRQNGVLQPLVVRPSGEGYELIAGERRLRASRMAGLETVPVVVQRVGDEEARAFALVENIQRQDLNPVERARGYRRLIEEFDYTQSELAERLGASRSAVGNTLRLLTLPESVQTMLAAGEIAAGHARALTSLPDATAERLAERIERDGLSVRDAESLGRAHGTSSASESKEEASTTSNEEPNDSATRRDDARTRHVTDELQRALGTRVELNDRHGEGTVEIHYDSYEVLQGVLDRIL